MSEGMQMDPIRFEVMRSAFSAAADEMSAALRKSAYSTNIKTRADFSCALYDANVQIIAQSFSQPIHLASMSRMIPSAIRLYGPERLQPGDAIAFNDSHQGAMHLNDIGVIAPFFHDGELSGYAASVAHHVDIGGMAPGGLSLSTDIYQEGVIIPPVRLLADGEIVEDIFNLIVANIRSPKQMAGDFRAQVAAAMVGQKRMVEIVERFGRDTVDAFTEELIQYTQRWTRSEIEKLPEGTYYAEAHLDDDGITDEPIRLCVKATVADGSVHFDLEGTDEQRSSPMNGNLTYAYAALSYVVKCLIDPDVPPNAGFYARIHVAAPEGTIVNPRPPAGVVGGNEIAMRLCDIGFKAFADALPERICACSKSVICSMGCGGLDPRTGDYYTFMETVSGGYGGRSGLDGLEAVQSHIQNTENSPVEETENNYPMIIRRYELVNDSDGAGEYRGGLGVRRDWQFPNHEATFSIISDGRKFAPWGLFGGHPGGLATYTLDPEGEARDLPSKVTMHLEPEAVVRFCTPGGGGYGSPLARDPLAVLRDVVDEKVSLERARDIYGVVIDLEKREVDEAATAALRAKEK